MYGKSVVTGFARFDGWPVAVMASDPFYGGGWTADTCRKVEKFVDTADTFHLPIVYLADCPGFQIGLEAEKNGTIKEGVKAMSAIWQTTTPWCSVIIRNAFGVAGAAHKNGGRYCTRYAWPSGRWGSLPLEGGIEAAYRADIDAADDPDAKMAEIEGRLNKLLLALPLRRVILDRGNCGPKGDTLPALRLCQYGRSSVSLACACGKCDLRGVTNGYRSLDRHLR